MADVRLTRQIVIEHKFQKQLDEGHYTIDKPLIIVDPYGLNPLSAYLLLETDQAVAVTVVVKNKSPLTDIVNTFPKCKRHILPVIGLYHDQMTVVEVSIYQHEVYSHPIQTAKVESLDELVIDFKAEPIVMANKLLVYASPVTWFEYHLPFGIDALGDVRWILMTPLNFDIKQMKNGHLIAASGDMVKKPYYVTGLLEFDWMGKIYKFYDIDTWVHHDFIKLNDRELLVLTDQKSQVTTEDSLIVFNRETGEILKRWIYQDFLDSTKVRRSGSGSSSDFDWFHNNAVWYDAFNNSITLSSRHMDALINMDYDLQKINWILSNPIG